jgi:flagellar biosynthesis/type III secretory pathway protein FliH
VEQTLFKPDSHQPAPRHWLHDTWLHSSDKLHAQFGELDWAQVPKLDFASVLFKQLATPESAKVFDSSEGFVLETYGQHPLPTPRSEKRSEIAAKAEAEMPALEAYTTADKTVVNPPVQAKEKTDSSVLFGEESFWRSANPDIWDMFTDEGETDQLFDSADWAAAREVVYQEGFSAGREEGYQAGHAQGHESGKLAGMEEGKLIGYDAAQSQADASKVQALEAQKQEILASLDDQKLLLKEVTDKLQAMSDNPQALFEPLKRLALHISEHMVLAELNISGQAIERLVQRCLDEIDLHGQPQVVIELHPQDKARLQELAGDVMKHMQIQAVPTLQPGSVRVLMNDTQIEDLVQNRMQTLANSLLTSPEAWREQSVFFRQPLAQREGQAEDVPQRVEYQEPMDDSDILDGDPHA